MPPIPTHVILLVIKDGFVYIVLMGAGQYVAQLLLILRAQEATQVIMSVALRRL